MTLTWNIRKCWTLRKTGSKKKNHQGGSLLRRKQASYQWNILQVTKYLETNTKRNQSKETTAKTTKSSNGVHKDLPTSMVPHRFATKVNQSEMTLNYFNPLRTHECRTHTHTL